MRIITTNSVHKELAVEGPDLQFLPVKTRSLQHLVLQLNPSKHGILSCEPTLHAGKFRAIGLISLGFFIGFYNVTTSA